MALSTAFILSLIYYCAMAASSPNPSSSTKTSASTTDPTTIAIITQSAGPITQTAAALTPPPPYLNFTCATNGIITDIFGVNKEDVVILNGSSSCHLNEAGCKWENQKKLDVLHVEGEKSSEIVGGKHAHFYQLECKTAGAFVASVNTSIQLATPATTDFNQEIKKPTEPTKTIRLTITDKNGAQAKTVHIGDTLLLTITGPVDYTIEPISCNASSSKTTDYVLWTNELCSSKDTAVIEHTWNQNQAIANLISIPMYGFRFVDSDTVMITCSAMFCPKGLPCSSKHCVDVSPHLSGRRKRNADVETDSENGYIEESFSTSFTVVDNRMDTSACSGTFVSVFTYATAFALMLAFI